MSYGEDTNTAIQTGANVASSVATTSAITGGSSAGALAAIPGWGWAAIGIGAIAGFFGSRRKRKRERRKRERAKILLNEQYGALQRAQAGQAAEFAQQRSFMNQAARMEQSRAIDQYGIQEQQALGGLGRTNLAGSGAGQQLMEQSQNQFQREQEMRGLKLQESAFGLQMREASAVRDIQSAGFELDRYAAEKGIKSNYGQSLLSMYGGY